jgi:hypothetical protein
MQCGQSGESRFPDAFEVHLGRIRLRHAFDPHSILRWSAASDEFGHGTAFLAVEEISHKDGATHPDSTQGTGRSHSRQETVIGGTVSGQLFSTLFCKPSRLWPHTQPERPILLGAWADFRPLRRST